MHTAKPLVL